jgi:hypothetical protein
MPRFENPILDKDLTDERFQVFDSGRKVSVKTLTPAQEAALKKRRELAEKNRQIKMALLAKKKKREQERKEREKERQRQLELERKEKAEAQRLANQEKQRLAKIAAEERAKALAIEKAEREALKKILDEERCRLAEARRAVKAIATSEKKSEESQSIVPETPEENAETDVTRNRRRPNPISPNKRSHPCPSHQKAKKIGSKIVSWVFGALIMTMLAFEGYGLISARSNHGVPKFLRLSIPGHPDRFHGFGTGYLPGQHGHRHPKSRSSHFGRFKRNRRP